MVCRVRDAPWDLGGREAEETQQNRAKTMRRPSENLANNTLLAPCLRAAYTLTAGRLVAGRVVDPGDQQASERPDATPSLAILALQ